MREIFIVADNIVSPLGSTSTENFIRLKAGASGIRLHSDPSLSSVPVYASLLNEPSLVPPDLQATEQFTKFEELLVASIREAVKGSVVDVTDDRTVLIVSSTKGNISLIESGLPDEAGRQRLTLTRSAQLVADYFQFVNKPVVVSHACVSGLVALITGMRMLQSGLYDHAVVAGADRITRFILSGFQSFQAISAEPCKPFDAKRNGITLGEGAATVVLSVTKPVSGTVIKLAGGASSNDANHISGPSRTGEELLQAVTAAMNEAGMLAENIDFISAHGTATIYNDEMEAKAIHLAGMQAIPVNSLKGYYGHTLGAAGLIETVVAVHSLQENIFLPTKGFEQSGTPRPLHITTSIQSGSYNACLKTASGFGGCNAAIVLQKAV